MKPPFVPGDKVIRTGGTFAGTSWIIAGAVRVPSSDGVLWAVVCESAAVKGLLQIFEPNEITPGHAVTHQNQDGIFDNGFTQQREWWCNGKKMYAIDAETIVALPRDMPPWGHYPNPP